MGSAFSETLGPRSWSCSFCIRLRHSHSDTGSTSREGMLKYSMDPSTPLEASNACSRGDRMLTTMPLLELTTPDTMLIFFFGTWGVMALMITPKANAPEPAGSRMPRLISSIHCAMQKGIITVPTVKSKAPTQSTNRLDLRSATMPNMGCAAPYTS